MPRNYAKKLRRYNENDVKKALASIRGGSSILKASRTYGMSDHMLRDKLKKLEKGESLASLSGRKPAIPAETELKLSQCIAVLCNLGFSPTREEILNLVRDYLNANNINISTFKDNRPGYDWFNSFMGRNNLSLKKANMICIARKICNC